MLYSPDGLEPLADEPCEAQSVRAAIRATSDGWSARRRAELRVGRYSLFTGDVGVALFAAACLEADARFTILDRI